jgi:hypothetical protein
VINYGDFLQWNSLRVSVPFDFFNVALIACHNGFISVVFVYLIRAPLQRG